jgi:hypothetical protein
MRRQRARTPKSLQSGPNGGRKRERREAKALRAASLQAMIWRTRWAERHPERLVRDEQRSLYTGRSPEDPTAEEFRAALFPEAVSPEDVDRDRRPLAGEDYEGR